MIFFAGGILAFFFEFLLLSKKNKNIADNILTFWMFILGVHIFLYYFRKEGIDIKYPHLLGIGVPLPFIHGPLLFLYTGFLTRYLQKWKLKYLLHFLPVIFFYCYYFDFFISSGEDKIEFIEKLSRKPDIYLVLFYPMIVVSGFTYILLTFLQLRRHRRNILNNLSNSNEKNNLHWLRNLVAGMLVIWMVVLLGHFVLEKTLVDPAIYFSVTLFVVFIGFFGLRQGNIFINMPDFNLVEGLTQEDQQRYTKSGLKEEQVAGLKQQLEELMDERKIYLDENISLPKLAGIMNIHPNYLSQVINERFQKNFYDFVNSYRIEEFKRIVVLEKNRNKTFFALALDCGFNSKASFNNSFKKLTGITPSQFIKSL